MSYLTTTANNPKYNRQGAKYGATGLIKCLFNEISDQLGEVTGMDIALTENVMTVYDAEQGYTTNPLQLNSTIETKKSDDETIFRGYVLEKPRIVDDNNNIVVMSCRINGNDGVLLKTVPCDSNGKVVWSKSTSDVQVKEVKLYPITYKSTTKQEKELNQYYFPYPVGTFDWTGKSGESNNKLFNTIPSDLDSSKMAKVISYVGTTLVLDAKSANFDAAGILEVKSSANVHKGYVYYSGRAGKGYGTSTEYTLTVIANPAIVPAADKDKTITISKDDLVVYWYCKELAPMGWLLRQYNTDLTPAAKEYLDGNTVVPNPLEGKFIMGARSYEVTAEYYSVFDTGNKIDSGSTQVTIGSLVKEILMSPRAYGGAGIPEELIEINLPESKNLALTRVDYKLKDKDESIWSYINTILGSVGYAGEIKLHYNHITGKFELFMVEQKAAGSEDYELDAISIERRELDTHDVVSGVWVCSTVESAKNALQAQYSWVLNYGLSRSDAEYINYAAKCTEDLVDLPPEYVVVLQDSKREAAPAKGNKVKGPIFDQHAATYEGYNWYRVNDSKHPTADKPETGGQKDANFDAYFFWFDDTYGEVELNKISVDFSHWSEADYEFSIWGTRDFTRDGNGIPDVASDKWFDLGSEVSRITGKGGGTDGSHMKYETENFTQRKVNGLKIVIHKFPMRRFSGGNKFDDHLFFHNFSVYANIEKYDYVKIVPDEASAGAYDIVAPITYEKLHGGYGATTSVAGVGRVARIDIGAAMEGAAQTIGQMYLIDKLKLYESYEVTSHVYPTDKSTGKATRPIPGRTIKINGLGGTIYGVIRGVQIKHKGDGEGLELKMYVLDTAQGFIV